MIPAPFGGVWRLEIHDTLGSTSDEVISRAHAGEPGGLAVLARRQTRGRGTGNKSWSDGAGNLAISVLLRPGRAITRPTQLGIRAAVALHETLSREISPRSDLRIKWPNDVLHAGCKLAGILVETAIAADGAIDWACIGLGVNLASAPVVVGIDTACLADAGVTCEPVDVARSLLAALTDRMSETFDVVRNTWSARAHRLGEKLSVRWGGVTLEGSFVGLGESGELLLDVDGERVAISNGGVTAGGTGSELGNRAADPNGDARNPPGI